SALVDKRVSARHQVNGRIETSPVEGRYGRRNGLSSFGAGRSFVPQFHPGPRGRGLRFGPDVFADALVPPAGDRPGFFIAPTSLVSGRPRQRNNPARLHDGLAAEFVRPVWPPNTAARGLAAMVIVVPNATVNQI